MRFKYLDISQTFFQDFSFHVTVVFFIVVNQNTRVLLNLHPPLLNFCALCKKPIGCNQSSQAWAGQKKPTKKLVIFPAASLSHSPERTDFPKCLSFLQSKEIKKQNKTQEQTRLSPAARHFIGRAVHKNGERRGTQVWMMKIPSFSSRTVISQLAYAIGPYVSASSIHIFIIGANKVHLVCWRFFFSCLLVIVRTWCSFSVGCLEPQKHMT